MGEGNETVDPALLDIDMEIDRGELITQAPLPPIEQEGNGDSRTLSKGGTGRVNGDPYLRYMDTPSGISPRAIPGVPGHLYVSGSDEHDEDGVLISDVYTDTTRRKKMVDKRARKFSDIFDHLPAPQLEGPAVAEVTLVGWGSTWGVIHEAVDRLNHEGISANYVQFTVLFPFHAQAAQEILWKSRRIVVVENNHSGQFARHLRAETGIAAIGHIRKYDGEPFEPKHIVAGVKAILEQGSKLVEVLSTEPGWRTEHPSGTTGDWPGRRDSVAAGGRQHIP
jgi:2-oxoglutarate ferredoxin oxidoreductase subunit alpha